jgi:hypothetical protein
MPSFSVWGNIDFYIDYKEFFMNKRFIFLVMLVCLLAFVAVMAFSISASDLKQPSQPSQQSGNYWEYTAISISGLTPAEVTTNANRLGKEGWELVTGATASQQLLVFKRYVP